MNPDLAFLDVVYYNGVEARSQSQFAEAFKHFTNALDIYHCAGYSDPCFLSEIFWQRADVSLVLGRYDEATKDISQAIKWNPKGTNDMVEANKWLKNASMPVADIGISLSCFTAALHFSKEDKNLQSVIYGLRGDVFHQLHQNQQRDKDVEKCRKCDPAFAMEKGKYWKDKGICFFHEKDYQEAVRALQLAEKFLMPFEPSNSLNAELKQHLHDSLNVLACAAWNIKRSVEALRAGKKCYELKSAKDKIEASRWRMKGNEILTKDCNYNCAIQCYTLAIQYAPLDNQELLGILYSNRSSAYFRNKQFMKAKADAEKCLEYRPQWTKSYHRLGSALIELQQHVQALEVLRRGLNVDQTEDEQYQIFLKIIHIITNCQDGPMKINFELPQKCLSAFLKDCAHKEDWKTVELLFLGGGGQQSHPQGAGGIATGCDASHVSLSDLIKSKNKVKDLRKLLSILIDHGSPLDGFSSPPPLSVAVNEKDYESALVLLERNADIRGLLKSRISKPEYTPIHASFRIGLSSGSWSIFNFLMSNRENHNSEHGNSNSDMIDSKGNSLFHMIASAEGISPNLAKSIELLKKYNVDPTTRNKNGQTALMMLRRKKDGRYQLIEDIVKSYTFRPTKKKKKNKKNKKNKDSAPDSLENECRMDIPRQSSAVSQSPSKERTKELERQFDEGLSFRSKSEIDDLRDRIAKAIDNLEIVNSDLDKSQYEEVPVNSPSKAVTYPTSDTGLHVHVLPEDKRPLPVNEVNMEDSPKHSDDEYSGLDVQFDDNLTWEVECTSSVWKILSGTQLSLPLKKRVVQAIRRLASGRMYGNLAISLKSFLNDANILLFEAKVSKEVSIIWERAIAFSPRCSNNSQLLEAKNDEIVGGIYSEIIRIWDVVFAHDTLQTKIENIARSHDRGASCIVKKELYGFEFQSTLPERNNNVSAPNLYICKTDKTLPQNTRSSQSSDVSIIFCPPGSPEETEYHILKFYAFSNTLVSAVLDDRGKTNVDFPFRVSELEHAVINLKPNPMTSLLLLGRSGTGKTTCCLYRLWCNFQTYWQGHSFEEPSLPKSVQFIPIKTKEDVVWHDDGQGHRTTAGEEGEAGASDENVDRNAASRRNSIDRTSNKAKVSPDVASCSQATCGEVLATDGEEPAYEHLHQAFITKNAVLCTEVQKNFLDLSRACPATRSHCEYQRSSSVNRFDQLEELSWPLFVCSCDWLLMLDASLPEPAFFPRNEEGELLRTVKGWGEEDNHLHEIPEENSEDEDVEENEADTHPKEINDSQAPSGLDPRLEVTYQVFKNELWPKMTKKKKVHYHPSLVWTEIRSFIKGSVEALHSDDGYLSLEDYQRLGRKRAPSFSADREIVYELFFAYHRLKRFKGMFDEADLVYGIHRRLQGYSPDWSIHEIYVDETQDFTQAELSVIIRCCRNPNGLFFTGDTAQSIMRGVAFRFNDLKSLFYYMKESYKAVGQQAQVRVPDRVYQLTHNYRSHAGILNLASSVIDLLLHFFPESFDRMERDQGLFDGPKPVLLESCSFSDLAVILRGHKRKTSPIEFGAHQVVLVASDEVRESLPEELSLALVMTIYEAKGLEFDDVLIYNFFKDSQARKEWRVVNSYRGEENMSLVADTGIAEIPEERLETKTRPLEFDPECHKILISEFKYLYTALTRARVNVWLFDEDEEARAPMFEYFKKRGVAQVRRTDITNDDKVSLEEMFAQKSSKEEWKNQGHFFYGKALWKVASRCFSMADDEAMVMRCEAQIQAAVATSLRNDPRKLSVGFLRAADLFLQCGMSQEAAICLHNSRARLLLAKLYEKLGKVLEAAQLFQRERKFLDASKNFESGLDYMRAIDCLLQVKCYDQALEVVSRCQKLMQDGSYVSIVSLPRFDQRAESICYQAAEYYLKRGQLDQMTSAIEKLPEVKDRITFLQKNGCVERAAELMLKEGKTQEAAEMMRSNGKFLEAASFTESDIFAAECYLITARIVLAKENKENVMNEETKELIEAPLQRASELFESCGDFNGEAEVSFLRGRFYGELNDLYVAGSMYYRAHNYTGMVECLLLLIDLENDLEVVSRPTTSSTVIKMFDLMLALHKKKQENIDRIVTTVCEKHFGLVDTGKSGTRKVPQMEMSRFACLNALEVKGEEISVVDAYQIIREHLHKIAATLIKMIWCKHQRINEQNKPCPHHFFSTCEEETCKFHHGSLTRQHFADRLDALCFLIHIDAATAKFLKELKQESPDAAHRLRQTLLLPYEFKACSWLEELLFPREGQLGESYVLTERQLFGLREEELVRDRIIKYAKSSVWCSATEEDRWSNSDLFISVSNLMHVAGTAVADIFKLLNEEQKKFESNVRGNVTERYGFFPAAKRPGCFQIFSRWLEHSKNSLYRQGNVLNATHSVVRVFLFTPARRTTMPYPSIANAVMILEYYMTALLLLHNRLCREGARMLCLPASYLSFVKYWDMVNRTKSYQYSLYDAIQLHDPTFKVEEATKMLERLRNLNNDMVLLMFGGISRKYNIFTAALSGTSECWEEGERALILALTMLCNCGRGIPSSCDIFIRKQFENLQSTNNLPNKLKRCVRAVQESGGICDVVIALQELLGQTPRQEKLFDVKWNEKSSNEMHRPCQPQIYPKCFCSLQDEEKLLNEMEPESCDSQERREPVQEDDIGEFRDIPVEEDVDNDERFEDYESQKKQELACIVIQKAFRGWMEKKRQKEEERINNDPVESRFQMFKLDRSGCTICGNVQFGSSADISPPAPSARTNSNWQPKILKRNTYSSHCSPESPHWRKEKLFLEFKDFYRREVFPSLKRAQELELEMRPLVEEKGGGYMLDHDQLEQAISKLQSALREVERERVWDHKRLVYETVHEVVKKLKSLDWIRTNKGDGGSRECSSNGVEKTGEESEAGKDCGDDLDVGNLKEVSSGVSRRKKRKEKMKKKARK